MITSKFKNGVVGLMMASSLLLGNPLLTRTARAEPLTLAVVAGSVGMFLFQWLAGHALDEATGVRGTVDVRRLRSELAHLAETDREHAEILLQLQDSLNDKMSRAEVESLLREALGKVDGRLAKLELEVACHDRELVAHAQSLGLHEAELTQLRQQQAKQYSELASRLSQHSTRLDGHDRDVARLNETTSRHESRLDRHANTLTQLGEETQRHRTRLEGHDQGLDNLTDEVVDLRRTYPRIDAERQGAQLVASGVNAMQRGDWNEARRSFQLGQAVNSQNPAAEYGLAVALRHLGQTAEADAALARAIVLERNHGLGKRPWITAERFQGADRHWVDSARRDPVYGVYTPGDLGAVAGAAAAGQADKSKQTETARAGSR